MDVITRRLFDVVFQEAHVIDLDFSQRDRRLRLVVVAGLTPGNFEGRGPLHNVDFVEVTEFSWHLSHPAPKLDSPDEHCQWVIMDFNVTQNDRGERITLSGYGHTPQIEITCNDVRISELDPNVIDLINPHWNNPSLPLARPGFEELLKLFKRK